MRQLIWVYLKGIAMGAADVVPGVSGGTIAFITGIYERLIRAIKNLLPSLKLFFKGQFKEFWKKIDGTFLLFLILGIATSFLTLAHVVTFAMDHYPVLTWAFFFGLIIASTLFVGRTVKWNWKTILAFMVFTVIAFVITSPENAPLNSDNAYWYIFLCGAIAICAMILPGISGSFILLLLGKYYFMMDALKNFEIVYILVFVLGALIGIVSFANVLSWLFKHFEMITLASLTGFMFGSLNKIWPWKETLQTYEYKGVMKPLVEKNISPVQFDAIQGNDNQLLWAILIMIFGFVLIFAIEFLSLKLKKETAKEVVASEDQKLDNIE